MNGFLQLLGSLRNIFIYVSMCISIPSFLLYCSECAVIIRHRKLHNSFNWLFIARAIPSLLNFLSSVFGYRLPTLFGTSLLPIYELSPLWLLRVYYFLFYFCYYSENLATLFVQFNRLVAVAFPLKYEEFWQKFLPFSLAIIYGVPMYLSYYFFTMGIQLLVIPNDPFSGNSTTFGIVENGTTYCIDEITLASTFTLLLLIVCTGMNVITLILYKCKCRVMSMSNQARNANNHISQRIERNLLIYAMATFLAHVFVSTLILSYAFAMPIDDPLSFSALFATYPIISDFSTVWLPSWFLIWANSAFRDHWVADMVPKRMVKWHKRKARANSNVINVQPALQMMNVAAFNLVDSRRQSEMTGGFNRSIA